VFGFKPVTQPALGFTPVLSIFAKILFDKVTGKLPSA
jgi:hypothetical protein